MLKIETKKTKSNTYELWALSDLKSCKECESLTGLKSNVETLWNNRTRRSIATVSNCYKLILSEDYKKVEMWHVNVHGTPDRLVAIVTKGDNT